MTYFPPTVDIHQGDPAWDYDETENPHPTLTAHSALIRSVPAQRVAVESSKEEVR